MTTGGYPYQLPIFGSLPAASDFPNRMLQTSAGVFWSNGTSWVGPFAGAGGFSNTILSLVPAADQQNWTLTGKTSYTTVLANPADNSFIGGFTGGVSGDILIVQNSSASGLIWFVHEDASSTAANRLTLARAGVILFPGESITLQYNGTATRWVETSVSLDIFQADDKSVFFLPSTGTAVIAMGRGGVSTTATISTVASALNPTNDFQEDTAVQLNNATANGTSDVRANNLNFRRGSTAGRQGIFTNGRVRFTALGATGGVWAGMADVTTAITTQPRNSNNTFGIGAHGGETTLRVWSRNTTAATAVDLGAGFPAPNATAAYEYCFLSMPSIANLRYMVRRLDVNNRTQGTITTNLITNTVALGPRANIMVGATAAASTMQFSRLMARSVS